MTPFLRILVFAMVSRVSIRLVLTAARKLGPYRKNRGKCLEAMRIA
jgi:hypothetical protein